MSHSLFAGWVENLGLSLSDSQLGQFEEYKRLLLDWNNRINLTAITKPTQIEVRHFYDSLSAISVTGDLNDKSLIDIGTGAGFPGIPLKIAMPELHLTLVDSVTKKTRFLKTVVDALKLSHVTVIAARAEELGQDDKYRQHYDWATARGVAHLATLAEFLLPLCHIGGHGLALKSGDVTSEIAEAQGAVRQLGGGDIKTSTIQLPDQDTPHYLVVIEKSGPTDPRYPRRVGVPAKRPLRQ